MIYYPDKNKDPKSFLSSLIIDSNMEISSDQIVYQKRGKRVANAFKSNNKSYLAKLFSFLQYESIECPDCQDVFDYYASRSII